MFPHRARLPIVNLAATAAASTPVPVDSIVSREAAMVLEREEAVTASEWSWRVARSSNEIDDLARDWRRLLSNDAAPFHTFAWVRGWYRHFADSYEEPLVFVVSRRGRPVAIFPCYVRDREIRLAGDQTCDYQDVIAEDEEAIRIGLGLFLAWIRRMRPAHEVFFEKLSSRGHLYPMLVAMKSRSERMFVLRKNYGPCPFVELPESLDFWLKTMPRKQRGDMRRALNRLARELPEAEVSVARDCSIPDGMVRDVADFHVRNFRKEGTSPLADSRLVALIEEVSGEEEVGLRVSRLQAGNIPLAIDLGFTRGGTYYGYLTGFDSAFSRFAPGKCLLLNRVDWWVREDGIRVLDFLCGGERYKEGFTGGSRYLVCSVRLMPRTIPNAARYVKMMWDWALRAIARRVGFLPELKTSAGELPKRGKENASGGQAKTKTPELEESHRQ